MRKPQPAKLSELKSGNIIIFPLAGKDGMVTEHLGYYMGARKNAQNKTQMVVAPIIKEDQENPFPAAGIITIYEPDDLKKIGLQETHSIMKVATLIDPKAFQDRNCETIGFIAKHSPLGTSINDEIKAAAQKNPAFFKLSAGVLIGRLPEVQRREELSTSFDQRSSARPSRSALSEQGYDGFAVLGEDPNDNDDEFSEPFEFGGGNASPQP